MEFPGSPWNWLHLKERLSFERCSGIRWAGGGGKYNNIFTYNKNAFFVKCLHKIQYKMTRHKTVSRVLGLFEKIIFLI